MSLLSKPMELSTSPHLKKMVTVDQIMRNVVYALLPVCAWSVYQFGISALMLIVVTTTTCVLTERLFDHLSRTSKPTMELSVVITGLLIALTLPPGFPLWMGTVASFIAVALGKVIFGGLGYNVMNPALVGRAFVQAAFPVAITTWTPPLIEGRFVEFIPSSLAVPFMSPVNTAEWVSTHTLDGFSGATPLALQKFEQISTKTMDLFLGNVAGSMGETSAIIVLLCGAYLAIRKMMDWRIAVSVLVTAALTTLPFYLMDSEHYPSPVFMLLSGGLMLGAVFMATDMVGSPMTSKGVWLYGAVIGFLTIIIRLFGGLTEGVMYAILVANALSPMISSITQPRKYGLRNKEKNS